MLCIWGNTKKTICGKTKTHLCVAPKNGLVDSTLCHSFHETVFAVQGVALNPSLG